MLEKLTNAAERLATGVGVSRRGFLGWAGRGALAVAGVLAVGGIAKASNRVKPCCKPGGGCPFGYVCSGCRCKPLPPR